MVFCPKCGTKSEGEKTQVPVLKTNKKMKNTLEEAAWMGAVAVGLGIIILGVGLVVEEQIANKNTTHDLNEVGTENYDAIYAFTEDDYDYEVSSADCSEDFYKERRYIL